MNTSSIEKLNSVFMSLQLPLFFMLSCSLFIPLVQHRAPFLCPNTDTSSCNLTAAEKAKAPRGGLWVLLVEQWLRGWKEMEATRTRCPEA